MIALLLPAAADAATVHAGRAPNSPYPCCIWGQYSKDNHAAYYDAKSGERNDVTVAFDSDGVVRFHDDGARVEAGEGCVQEDGHSARCGGVVFAQLKLGDGDDAFNEADPPFGLIALPTMRVLGGRGNDVLGGGNAPDELDGGGGHDMLFGAGGTDVITDGDRSGATGESRPGTDVMDGGGLGTDLISYARRTKPVSVNLNLGVAGEAGERDQVRDFDGVDGGSGDDRLIGDNSQRDYLFGHDGDDEIHGLGGQDDVEGGAGADRLFGDSEEDFVYGGPGLDTLSCGSENDTVASPEGGERLTDCEWAGFSPPPGDNSWNTFGFEPYAQRVSQSFVEFGIDCPQYDPGEEFQIQPCAGTLRIRTTYGRHRLLGFAHRTDQGPYPLRAKLTKEGQRLIHRPGGVIATVSLRGAPTAGIPWPRVAWTIRIEG